MIYLLLWEKETSLLSPLSIFPYHIKVLLQVLTGWESHHLLKKARKKWDTGDCWEARKQKSRWMQMYLNNQAQIRWYFWMIQGQDGGNRIRSDIWHWLWEHICSTFVLVAKMNTFWILLSLVIHSRWQLHQFDVKKVSLHGELKEEEVYMEISLAHQMLDTYSC